MQFLRLVSVSASSKSLRMYASGSSSYSSISYYVIAMFGITRESNIFIKLFFRKPDYFGLCKTSPMYFIVSRTNFSDFLPPWSLFYSTRDHMAWKEISLYSEKYSPNLNVYRYSRLTTLPLALITSSGSEGNCG